ncbi:MAG: hypothetical protein AB2L14_25150 [Candidatus Xenobiia bacterium LiM19]
MKLKNEKNADDDIPDATRAPQKWEYKVEKIASGLEKRLDLLGEAGWELVTIKEKEEIIDGSVSRYIWTVFKRPVY